MRGKGRRVEGVSGGEGRRGRGVTRNGRTIETGSLFSAR